MAAGRVPPGERGDETWGDVPYEERVHVGVVDGPSVDLDLNLVFVGTSVTSLPRSPAGRIENTHPSAPRRRRGPARRRGAVQRGAEPALPLALDPDPDPRTAGPPSSGHQ